MAPIECHKNIMIIPVRNRDVEVKKERTTFLVDFEESKRS